MLISLAGERLAAYYQLIDSFIGKELLFMFLSILGSVKGDGCSLKTGPHVAAIKQKA